MTTTKSGTPQGYSPPKAFICEGRLPHTQNCKRLSERLERPTAHELAAMYSSDNEKDVYMSDGRGRGPHILRNYSCRPAVRVTEEIPHCHGLSTYLATRGALSRPAPGGNLTCCSGIPGYKGDEATAFASITKLD